MFYGSAKGQTSATDLLSFFCIVRQFDNIGNINDLESFLESKASQFQGLYQWSFLNICPKVAKKGRREWRQELWVKLSICWDCQIPQRNKNKTGQPVLSLFFVGIKKYHTQHLFAQKTSRSPLGETAKWTSAEYTSPPTVLGTAKHYRRAFYRTKFHSISCGTLLRLQRFTH